MYISDCESGETGTKNSLDFNVFLIVLTNIWQASQCSCFIIVSDSPERSLFFIVILFLYNNSKENAINWNFTNKYNQNKHVAPAEKLIIFLFFDQDDTMP